MIRFLSSLAVSCVLILSAAAEEPLPALFNGKDLTGWKLPEMATYWKVVDGVLVGESDDAKKGSMLYTEASYGDVVMEAEVRWTGDIDSGFMVRKPEIQMQIGISRSLKKDMSGSFYIGKYPEEGQAKEAGRLVKVGEWNKFRLQAKGNVFTIWINGEKAVEYTNEKYAAPGPIGLQIHPGVKMKVEFRGIGARAIE
jgi:Domain of Unknown Function (DUF1080)